MPTITEIREKYPQYADLSDEQLARGLHAKHYSDLPYEDFAKRIGLKAAPKAKGFWERELSPEALKRGAGLTLRTLTEAATDIPTAIADIPAHLVNALGGGMPYSMAQQRDNLLTSAYGRPETNVESAINVVGRGAGGAGMMASGANLARGAANPIAERVLTTMAARPALQAASGASGAGASEIARQRGVSPLGQMAAGLAGGLVPAVLSPRAPTLPTPESISARVRPQTPVGPTAQAAAAARSEASVSPGTAATENLVSAAPEIRLSGGGAGRVGPDPSAGLSIPMQRVAAEGQKLGMRLTPGQATGSRALQQLEAKLESQPGTSGPFNTLKADNAKVLQRAAAQSIGEKADTVDDAVLARADERIGAVFDSIADNNARTIDPQKFLTFVGELQAETRGLVRGVTQHPLVDDLIGFANDGQATGRQLQNLTSKLGKAARMNMTSLNGDRELGLALYRVKNYVDDLLGQGLSEKQAKQFAEARGQYRNLMMLTQRVGVINPASGEVNPRSLASVLQSKDKGGYLYGENQSALYNATRFAQAFKPIVGDSGTATRLPFQSIPDFMVRIPLNIASRAYVSSPGVHLATGAQAAARAIGAYPAGVTAPFRAPDVPYGLFAGDLADQ